MTSHTEPNSTLIPARADPDHLGVATLSFGLSFAVTGLLDALLVVAKEISEDSLLTAMKAATGHHWVTHGVISIALFLILGLLFQRLGIGRTMTANGLTVTIAGSMILSSSIIVGFYLLY